MLSLSLYIAMWLLTVIITPDATAYRYWGTGVVTLHLQYHKYHMHMTIHRIYAQVTQSSSCRGQLYIII